MTDTTQAVISVANYIGGEWSPAASGETLESRDPSTGELVAVAPRSGVEDVERAIAAARGTFDDGAWPATSGRDRAAILFELARLLREEADALARLVAIEMGKPIRYVREREIEPAIDRILFYASAARMIRGEVTASAPTHLLNFILKEPVGVCALITPWNDPVDLPLRKIGAAIATGCTFVLKPATTPGRRRWRSSGCSIGSRACRRASPTGSSVPARWSARRWRPIRASTRSASPAAATSGGA